MVEHARAEPRLHDGGAAGRLCGIFWLERPPEDGGPAMPEVIR